MLSEFIRHNIFDSGHTITYLIIESLIGNVKFKTTVKLYDNTNGNVVLDIYKSFCYNIINYM